MIKKQSIIIAVSVIGMCLVLLGSSYALFFKVGSSTNPQTVETGSLAVDISLQGDSTGEAKLTALGSSIEGIVPLSDDEALGQTYSPSTFVITNNGDLPVTYDLIITYSDATLATNIPLQYIKIQYDNGTAQALSSLEAQTAGSSYYLAKNLSTDVGTNASHTIKMWISNDLTPPGEGENDSIVDKDVNLEIAAIGSVTGAE
jgi:hypothetical protein